MLLKGTMVPPRFGKSAVLRRTCSQYSSHYENSTDLIESDSNQTKQLKRNKQMSTEGCPHLWRISRKQICAANERVWGTV